MSSDIQLESIRRLGDDIYRIEWLGNILKTRKTGSTTPCVRVLCSRWRLGDGNATMRTRGVEPLTARVPLALMRYLRVGDLWRDGRFVGSSVAEEREYCDLKIDEETTRAQLAGASDREANGTAYYEMPFELFDGHLDSTDSWMVRIVVAEGTVLLIPAMEIARFYFGRSGALLTRLFDSAASNQKLHRKLNRNESTGEVDLELADGVPSHAACDVARLELDPAAQRTVRALTSSAIKARVNMEPFFPRVLPPIVGRTTLRVGGVSLRSGNREVFLVHYIASCSHPFPFTALRCHVWADADVKEEAGDTMPAAAAAPRTLSCDDHQPHPSEGRPRDFFPDLERKPVRCVLRARLVISESFCRTDS